MVARKFWTPEQEEILRTRYPHERTGTVAAAIDMSMSRVYSKAAALGLNKTPEYLASPDACRLRKGDNVGAAHRFQKGGASWNKGMKGLQIGGIETRFKPGHRGGKALEVYQPIGSERISKDGYLQRKVNNDMPLHKRWRGVHIIVWEEVNGPLPKGNAICFKDGNKQNITIGNLELVSRGDLMKRNSYHQYGKEIAQLVQLKGAVTRQINKREKASGK